MKAILLTLVVLILGWLIGYFAFTNPETTTIQLYKTQYEASKWLIFIACAIIGFVAAIVIFLPSWLAQRIQIVSLKHKCSKLDKQVSKKDKQISYREEQLEEKEQTIENLDEEIKTKEKEAVIKDAFLPKE